MAEKGETVVHGQRPRRSCLDGIQRMEWIQFGRNPCGGWLIFTVTDLRLLQVEREQQQIIHDYELQSPPSITHEQGFLS